MTTHSIYELMQKCSLVHLGLDPFSWYKQMRITNPVCFDEQEQLWELFRYKDIHAMLARPDLFSSIGLFGGEEDGAERGSLFVIDPPRHNKMRALVSQAFTPSRIAQQADTIRNIVNELLDASSTSDTLEVIQDLAAPLPIRVIAEILGIPLVREADFKCWARDILGSSPQKAVASWRAAEEYMRELLVQKRKQRTDDLMSVLLDSEIDGKALSEQELVDFCVLLLGAGFETTKHLIGNTLLCLDEHPDAREQVWADPSLVQSTIEEVLRFRSVIYRLARTVTKETEIGGKQFKAGERVFAWTASANRDEEQWRDPELFDIRRKPNPHLGFGSGIHVCIGAPLVRLEVKIALEQIIERFQDIQRIREVPLQCFENSFNYGVQQLPIRTQKRTKVSLS